MMVIQIHLLILPMFFEFEDEVTNKMDELKLVTFSKQKLTR